MSLTHITAVAFQEHGLWIAQCLEHDLCTSAKNYSDLGRKLASQLRLQIYLDRKRGKEPLQDIPRAPQKFWNMYSSGAPAEDVEIRGTWMDSLFTAWHRPKAQARLTLVTP